jgi:uncharacterized protein
MQRSTSSTTFALNKIDPKGKATKQYLNYWKRASAKPYLSQVGVCALELNAQNDPFIPNWRLPKLSAASNRVTLGQTAQGSHASFRSGAYPANVRVVPEAVTAFLATHP